MTLEEVEAAILNRIEPRDAVDDYADGRWDDVTWEYRKGLDVPDLGLVTVAQETGGEGQGDYASVVLQAGDRYFKKEGWYASYEGTTWDGPFTEVHPVDRVVRFYE